MDSLLKKLQPVTSFASDHTVVISSVAAVSVGVFLFRSYLDSSSKKSPKGPVNTVVLHGIGPGVKTPSVSPYVLKLETFLRLAKIPYVIAKDVTPSRKGKFPWISYNDEEIDDSQLCIEYLSKKFQIDLNSGLNDTELAVAHAFRVLLDEYQFWMNAYFKFSNLSDPNLLADFPSWWIRRYVKRLYSNYLHAQGMSRHSEREVYKMFMHNLQSIEDYIGDKLFLMGDEPTEVDCSLFGLASQLIWCPPGVLNHNIIKDNFPKLFQLCLRVKERAFPDWDHCLKK